MRNLVLYGMMGAGKSTVARLVALRLGRPMVDTDTEVECRAGKTIPTIFTADGEPAFRALERQVIAEVACRDGQVVAVGGGAVLDDDNLAALKARGALVWLKAPAEVLAGRLAPAAGPAGGGPGEAGVLRPLLAGRQASVGQLTARLEELLAERNGAYRSAATCVVDAAASPAEVADAVVAWSQTAGEVLTAAERGRLNR